MHIIWSQISADCSPEPFPLQSVTATELSKDMGCSPEFLLSMRKHEAEKITQFACFVKNSTPCAIRLSVPLGKMEEQDPIHPQVLKALIKRNRERYCTDLTGGAPPDTPSSPDDSPLDDPDLL
jgi:hypothetical protein